MVKDFIKENGRNTVLYATLLGCSAMINNQLAKIPYVAEYASKLEELVQSGAAEFVNPETASALVSGGEFVLGAGLLLGLGYALKRSVKKKQVRKLNGIEDIVNQESSANVESPAQENKYWRGFKKVASGVGKALGVVARKSVIPLAAAASIFASAQIFPETYELIANQVSQWLQNADIHLSNYASITAQVGAGILGILAFETLYKRKVDKKHGPILRRINVDGYTWIYEKFSWRNLVRGRKIKYLPFGGDSLTHLPRWAETTNRNDRITAKITARDYPSGKNEDVTLISYNITQEPHKAGKRIAYTDIDEVISHLKEYISNHKEQLGESFYDNNRPFLKVENLNYIAEHSQVRRAIAKSKKTKIKSVDVSRVLKAMAAEECKPATGNLLDVDTHECAQYLDLEGNMDVGKFGRTLEILDGESKTIVPRAYLIEAEGRTRRNSKAAYGASWANKDNCLFSARFSIKRGDSASDFLEGADDLEDEDYDEEDEEEHHLEGMAANTFEKWKKVGLRKLIDWGPGFKLFYKSKAYDIDMDVFGSIPLGRGHALRRKYYVKNSDNKIVAKMKEVSIWKKLPPLFDNNWQIDLYDPELARDGSFGYILSLITQYLRNDHLYNKNACQKALRKQNVRALQEEAV